MSTKDSDWDMDDDMEFGQEFEQESEPGADQGVTPGQDYVDYGSDDQQESYGEAYQEDYQHPDESGHDFPPVEAPEEYPSEYDTGTEVPTDNTDFDDYDFMNEGGGYETGEAYPEDMGEDEFSDYDAGIDPVARHEQRKRMDGHLGGQKKSPVATIAMIAVAGVLVVGGSYFALSGLFGGSDKPQPTLNPPVQDNMDGTTDNSAMSGQDGLDMPELVQDNIRPPSVSSNSGGDTGPLTPLPGEEEDIGFFTAENDNDDQGGIQFDVPTEQNDDNIFAPEEENKNTSSGEEGVEEIDITETADDFFQSLDEDVPSKPSPRMTETQQDEVSQIPVPTGASAQQVTGGQLNEEMLSQLKELNANISKLNTRMNMLEDNLETVEASLNSRMASLEKRPATPVSAKSPAPLVEEKVLEKQPVAATKTPSRPKASAASPKPPSWEIRAIQVGKAVVAQRGTQGSREIAVGDSLPGLGKIQAIDYRNGQWVISGSQGTIRE